MSAADLIAYFASMRREADGTSVSRPELERLQKQRKTATAQLTLTPDGQRAAAHPLETQHREDRIQHVRERLRVQRDHAVTDFALGKAHSVAKDGFERSR